MQMFVAVFLVVTTATIYISLTSVDFLQLFPLIPDKVVLGIKPTKETKINQLREGQQKIRNIWAIYRVVNLEKEKALKEVPGAAQKHMFLRVFFLLTFEVCF